MADALAENPLHIEHLCAALDLGVPADRPQRVFGGFHHRMWRLDTNCGSYAIKQLSSDTDLQEPTLVDHYNAAERVAEAFSDYGIPAISALRQDDGYLQVIDRTGYLVYPWTSAVSLGRDKVSEVHALHVAGVLARMHRADLQVSGLQEVDFDIQPEDMAIFLVRRANEMAVPGAMVLSEHLARFVHLLAAQEAAVPVLEEHRIISHGDLDQKNVLWDASGGPVIIDWESARRLNPTYEILMEALNWSGIGARFNHTLFDRMMTTYRHARGAFDDDSLEPALDCILGDWANWLLYNLGRIINLDDAEQRASGAQQINSALSTILRIQELRAQLLAGLRGAL